MKTKESMLEALKTLTDETLDYEVRLVGYEFLMEECDEIYPEMLEAYHKAGDGDTAKMILEILAGYKGHKEVYLALVSWLYRGEDVALFAQLLGSYGDEQAVDVLKGFLKEYEPNYHEYMEIRNAVEELGGYFEEDNSLDFSEDALYRYNKGLDTEAEELEEVDKQLDDITNPYHIDDAGDGEDEAEDLDEENQDD